jgi:hypothetical protein
MSDIGQRVKKHPFGVVASLRTQKEETDATQRLPSSNAT